MPVINRRLASNPPAVPAGKAKLRLFDDKLTGFLMEVRPTGTITFYIRYRDPRGRQREIKLGRYGIITVDAARKRAQELLAEASLHGDPAAERERLRAIPTFSDFVENRYLPFAKDRLKSYRDHESFYRLRLKAAWGIPRMDEIKSQDVADFQSALRRQGLSVETLGRSLGHARPSPGRKSCSRFGYNGVSTPHFRSHEGRTAMLRGVEVRNMPAGCTGAESGGN